MHLNVGISMTLRNLKILRVDNINPDSTIDDFKSQVAEKINYLKENIELSYRGKLLNDRSTLNDCGLNSGFVVNVLHKKDKEVPSQPCPISNSEIQDLVRVFLILSTRNAYRRVLQKLNKPDVLENIISTTPGLSEDPTAILILQHPELMAKLGDTEAVMRVVENHPSLANAARNLVAAVQNDMLISPSTSAASSHNSSNSVPYLVGSDDEDMELIGNGDSQSRSLEIGEVRQQPANIITPSQVAAALASTAATVSVENNTAPSNAAANGITPEMMSAALQQAIASTSIANVNTTNASSYNTSESREMHDSVTTVKLEELRKLGFTNDVINIQALQIANGDIETAVNVILSGLSDDI